MSFFVHFEGLYIVKTFDHDVREQQIIIPARENKPFGKVMP
jgi:hypothetical protein